MHDQGQKCLLFNPKHTVADAELGLSLISLALNEKYITIRSVLLSGHKC